MKKAALTILLSLPITAAPVLMVTDGYMAVVDHELHLDNDGVWRTTMSQLFSGVTIPVAFVEGLPWEPMFSEGITPLHHEEEGQGNRHDPPPPLEDHGHHDEDKPEQHQPVPEPGTWTVVGLGLIGVAGLKFGQKEGDNQTTWEELTTVEAMAKFEGECLCRGSGICPCGNRDHVCFFCSGRRPSVEPTQVNQGWLTFLMMVLCAMDKEVGW